MESYRDKFTEVRVIYEKNYNQYNESKSVISNKVASDNLKLPKLRLKEYDLMPRSWVAFWGQFSRVHEDENLREEDKFQYLLSSLKPKTKARDIAESYPPSKDNYAKVIEHLKSRFGRKDLLIEVYIRDLLALVNNKSVIKLADLYDKLGSYLRALETLGVTTSNYAAMLYPVVESCLPTEILKAWDRYRLNREVEEGEQILAKEKILENLMSFLRHEVEGEEHRVLAENAFGSGTKRKEFQKPVQRDEPTAATLISNTSGRKISCIFCDRPHPSQDCQKLSTINYDDRKSQVMRRKCCLVCLKPGHMAKGCHSSVKCLICGRRHYALLCPDLGKDIKSSSKDKVAEEKQKSTKTLLTNLPSEREIYLKTIMIRLRHRGKEICARALMDDGSHRSYIEKSLAAELNLSPSGKEMLSQGLFGGGITPAAEHTKYVVTIESLDRKYSTSMSLLDQPKICSTLPRIRDETLLVELASRGIKLTDVGRDSPPIRILLGADVLGSILTGRIEVLTSGISAVETLLGWTILGLGKKKQVVNMVTLNLQNFELPKMWDFIQRECALVKIKWIFSPPSAPWYGGFWERMVRCIKELLRKCLGKSCVTYEEMLTLLTDCEATINGRPLTYLSDDPNELRPLTPAHFIQDLGERETVDLDLIDSQHLLKRVRYLHNLRLNLRKRFYKEYLGELVRSPKSSSRRKTISPGEIVLVESKNPNRINWPLAQVIELFPGKDNIERVAKLRVANGEIIRPLQRIFPLELTSADNFIKMSQKTETAPETESCENEVPKNIRIRLKEQAERQTALRSIGTPLQTQIRLKEQAQQQVVIRERNTPEKLQARTIVHTEMQTEHPRNFMHNSWSLFNDSGLPYDPSIDYHNHPLIVIGSMSKKCQFCDALKEKDETAGMCCSKGKVSFSLFGEPEEPLKTLYLYDTDESKRFLSKIRNYNSCFQMTSSGVDKEIRMPGFSPTFTVQGQIYHRIG
ncbi:hypothetical protein X975_02399, partial [Stegodyphus mimosarum]